MGVRYFCDRCDKEFNSNGLLIPIYARDALGTKLCCMGNGYLCEKCAKEFNSIKDYIKYEEDFFTMKDEEVAKRVNYYKGARDFIEWLLCNDKYAACTIDTDEECILCEVGLIKDMWFESVDELFKEFQKVDKVSFLRGEL